MTASKGPLLPLLGRDPNGIRDVRLVGRYAIGVDWQDGHDSIYPFEQLRGGCPCGCGRAEGALAEAQVWPVAITRADTGLQIRWQDDHETVYGGRDLRQLCRCASCTTVRER
jgi:DUF971 family protein